jgi:hypothetical protein
VFYTGRIFALEQLPNLVITPAESYPAVRNLTGISRFKNFVVMSRDRRVLSFAHELMHILLNAPHRVTAQGVPLDPSTALFHVTRNDKRVDSTKRIGPYPDAQLAGAGNDDTRTLRANVETLP